MAIHLFDVFVVGASDPSPSGTTQLANALASKHGVPLATIAKAIAAKNLRAGQGLEQPQAQALVRQLQGIGAVTVIRPSGPPSQRTQVPMGTANSPVPGSEMSTPRAPTQYPVAPKAPSPIPESQAIPAGFGPPLGSSRSPVPMGTGPAQSPFPSPRPGTMVPGAPNPFEPPRGNTPVLGIARDRMASTPPPVPMHSTGLTQNDVTPGPRLELARGDRALSSEELSGMRKLPLSGSASNLRDVAASGASGVAMDVDPKNMNLVRCAQHGLFYDKSKASGCRKCLSTAREMANSFEARSAAVRVGSELRKTPVRRAFLGLAFALFLGLLPAAYYSLGPGASEAKEYRVEQEVLSRQPGTDEILFRFDELNSRITHARDKGMRNTAVVWIAITGLAMLGWYKVT